MPKNVLIRGVPDEVAAILAMRAKAAGQSMQEYLLARLTEMTQRLTMAEWSARVKEHAKAYPKQPAQTPEERQAEIDELKYERDGYYWWKEDWWKDEPE